MLYILSIIYSFITKINLYLHNNILIKYEAKSKVISIGNIIVGGSGKTPLTIYICNFLSTKGYKVAVVGRGYGRNNSNNYILLQNQSKIELNAENIGDEMLEIYHNTNADVFIGNKKFEMVLIADKITPKYDFIIIDDGFQHFKIKKDIEIVILDENTINENYLLPKGRLREDFHSLNRANIIVTRNNDKNNFTNLFKYKNIILNSNISFYDFNYEIKNIINYNTLINQSIDYFLDDNKNNYNFSIITAIANPNRFLDNLKLIGFEVQNNYKFRDHHNYKFNEINDILQNNDKSMQFITTEKDFVKLKPLLIKIDKISKSNFLDKFYFVKLELKENNINNNNDLINKIINFK